MTRAKFGSLFHVKHGFAFKSEFFTDSGPYVLLTPGNFHEDGGFRDQGEKQKYYTGHVPDGYVLNEGDLIVAMTEQAAGLLGSSVLVPASGRYLHNQRLGLVVDLDEGRLDRRYLYYLFNTRTVRHQISGSASGTKVRHTAPERIGRVEVELPPPRTQRRIGEILAAYDDLISNNSRRIAILEEAARSIYEEWFVRLRFPGHEHTRIVQATPEGWRTVPLSSFCPDFRDAADPTELASDTPYIGLEHMPRRSITLSEWGTAEEVTSTKLKYVSGDILFGKIRPYFHKVGIALTGGVTSSDSIVLRPVTPDVRAFSLLTLSSDWFVAVVSKTAKEGSKMPRADWNLMERHPIALPAKAILSGFNSITVPIVEQLRVLALANRQLRAARDLLLPRLVSRELAA